MATCIKCYAVNVPNVNGCVLAFVARLHSLLTNYRSLADVWIERTDDTKGTVGKLKDQKRSTSLVETGTNSKRFLGTDNSLNVPRLGSPWDK